MVVPCLPICLGGTGSGLTNESVKYLCKTLKTHSQGLLYHKKNIRKLREKFAPLRDARDDVNRSVEAAKRSAEVIIEAVSRWLEEVSNLEQGINQMESQVQEMDDEVAAAGCLKGSIIAPTYWLRRYQIGKEAAKRQDDVSSLLSRGNFESVSRPRPPPSIEDIPVDDFMDFRSTKEAADGVMEALDDVNKHLIGIYGMGGVGKTTLMMHIGRRLKAQGIFDTVIMVVVSQNPSVDQVRREIADELSMRLIGTGDHAAAMLAARLRQEKKVVIMLDDVWERLDLVRVGIPYGRDEQQGRICKILFTSRRSQVCDVMEVHASVPVDVLSPEDSWSLFQRRAGGVVNSPDVEPVAKKVAGECGGLPLALVVVGRASRGFEGKQEWEDALSQLKRSTPTSLEGVEEHLFKSLELSYQHLRDNKVKMLFLYCCLFREDYDISEDALTRIVVGESLVYEVHESLEAVRSSVRTLVKKLKASCLVQHGGKMGCIKLHDVVRDVAVYIASRDGKFLVKAGLGMRDWPEDRHLENCTRISLSNNDVSDVPQRPSCPQLETLLLDINPLRNGLPANFFDAMTALCVLDLSETGINSLPSSITRLTNLTTLCLNGCRQLHDISLIGQLTGLKMLRLQRSSVARLPQEIENLVNLRQLDMTQSRSLVTPYNLLSNLSRLEELYMGGCRRVDEALLIEILSLGFLSRLELFLDADSLPSDVIRIAASWGKLTQFFIYNVDHWFSLRSVYQKNMYLKEVGQLELCPKSLLSETEDLQLTDCQLNLIHLAELDEPKRFENLKKLEITKCESLQHLLKVDASEQAPTPNAYCNLQLLRLMYMEKFVGICSGVLPANSFGKLRRIHMERCPKVREPVPGDLLTRVNHVLQDLSLVALDDAEVVLSLESFQQQDQPVLPSLRALKLQGLPRLLRIWGGTCPPGSLQNLSTLDLHSCSNLEHLFFLHEAGTAHSYLLPLETFTSLKVLRVSRCGGLKYLFSRSIVNRLRNLEVLELKDNAAMEEIIAEEENVQMEQGAFPALKDLSLVNLGNLSGFYQGEPLVSFSWPSLRSIKLGGCPRLQRLPVGATDISAPHLKISVHPVERADVERFRNLQWTDPSVLQRFTVN